MDRHALSSPFEAYGEISGGLLLGPAKTDRDSEAYLIYLEFVLDVYKPPVEVKLSAQVNQMSNQLVYTVFACKDLRA